jgi:hypothetical protein
MRANEFIFETNYYETVDNTITPHMLQQLEYYIDKLFASLGIDVAFTKHFLDRVNDPRNIKPITTQELANLFKKTYSKWGKKIAQLGPDSQAVIKDMSTDINIPFVLTWNRRNQTLDLIAKTVMRKKNFTTPNQQLAVESFDTKVTWYSEAGPANSTIYGAKVNEDYIEIKYEPHDDGVYISFTRNASTQVTGEGNQQKIFGAVINHIKEWVEKNQPNYIWFSAEKPQSGPFGSRDTSRSELYKKMVQRFASQSGYAYQVDPKKSWDIFKLKRLDTNSEALQL